MQRCPAVLLPHAGWEFSGAVAAKTLVDLDLPEEVLLIGPAHTGLGARFALAIYPRWKIPEREIPTASALIGDLLAGAPLLCADNLAHLREHSLEVLLPLLAYRQPRLQIAPLLLGICNYEETTLLAQQLAAVFRKRERQPLVVVSSDMNHFATDEATRKLDAKALNALCEEGPEALYQTCRKKDSSMCGMLPMVTAMQLMRELHGKIRYQLVDYRTSGQVTGDLTRVVGYAGVRFYHEQ